MLLRFLRGACKPSPFVSAAEDAAVGGEERESWLAGPKGRNENKECATEDEDNERPQHSTAQQSTAQANEQSALTRVHVQKL